jgi:mitochondrial fission protein ELM1
MSARHGERRTLGPNSDKAQAAWPDTWISIGDAAAKVVLSLQRVRP